MKSLLLSFVAIWLLLPNNSISQTTEKPIKSRLLNIEEADSYFEYQDYNNALKLYLAFHEIDTLDAEINYKIGVCMYNLRKYKDQALPYLEKGVKGNIIECYYYLGRAYHFAAEFDAAIEAFNNYKNFVGVKNIDNNEIDRLIANSKNAKEMITHPTDVRIENIGNKINSGYPEYVPLISADESKLLFTSRRLGSTGGLLDPNGDFYEDIYISKKENGEWTDPVGVSKNVNTPSHDACVAFAAAGEKLIMYRNSKDLKGGDLYMSSFNGNDWTIPEKLNSNVNAKHSLQPSACISADDDVLYFSSNRKGGYGGKDLYMSKQLPNGQWGKAINLGPTINTAQDEDAPFLHPDGRTLYFSSKGHKNMGEYDIFKSYLSDDKVWSQPENLGYPINTVDDDIYFVLSTNGKRGYYSSTRKDGYGEIDIYIINFPSESFDLAVLKGIVASSAQDGKPLQATITLIDPDNKQQEHGIYNTNPLTGKFLLVMAPEKKYSILVQCPGYRDYAEVITISKETEEELKIIKMNKK